MESLATVLGSKQEADENLLRLSVSKVKTFKDCAAKYRFTYIEKLPRKEWDFHVFGTYCHEILEKFHQERLDGNIGTDEDVMDTAKDYALGIYSEKLSLKQRVEAIDIIDQYMLTLKEHQDNETTPEVISVEESFYIDVDGKILLNGFIDKVQLDHDGVLHVADYKTTKNKKYVKNDFMQLKTYAYVMCLKDPTLEVVRTSYVMLRHNCSLIQKEFKRAEIMKMEQVFLDYADKINEEQLFRPTANNLCAFCDHLTSCETGRNFTNARNGFDRYGARDW